MTFKDGAHAVLGSLLGAAVAFTLLTAPYSTSTPTTAERHPATLNGFPIELVGDSADGQTIHWSPAAQAFSPGPPLPADPGGTHSKGRYSIQVNGHLAEVLGWVDPDGFKWLFADQDWGAAKPPASPAPPTSPGPTAAMANGVVAGRLDREGRVTASDRQTQAAVESLIDQAKSPDHDVGRIKPPSLKKPWSLPSIPWAWIFTGLLVVAALCVGALAALFLIAYWVARGIKF